MKNALLLGLVAAVLFAVSAGLSLYLNQPKLTADPAEAAKSPSTKSATSPSENRDKMGSTAKPVVTPSATADMSEPIRLATQLQSELALISKREQDFERQQELYQVVIEDMRSEIETLWQLLQASPGKKRSPATAPAGPTKSDPSLTLPSIPESAPKKGSGDAPDASLQNLRLATGITESMQPENAAKIVEQLAKTGKMDLAVQLLAKLNPRQAAKILTLISDEKLSSQLFESLINSKARAPANPTP